MCLLASVSLLSVMNKAEGAVIITGQEVGNDVVFSHTGSIDLTGAGFTFNGNSGAFSSSFLADSLTFPFLISASENGFSAYAGTFTSAPSGGFGSNTAFVQADSASGDAFGVEYGDDEFFYVPIGYTSGATISGSATYNNATLLGLGFDVSQTYDWELANNDFIRLQFKTTPEPSTILGSVLVLGLGAVMGKTKKK